MDKSNIVDLQQIDDVMLALGVHKRDSATYPDTHTYVYIYIHTHTHTYMGFPCFSDSKESACSELQSLGQEDSPGGGKGYPCPYSCLENSMDCIVHGVTKSQTRLSDFPFHIHVYMVFQIL